MKLEDLKQIISKNLTHSGEELKTDELYNQVLNSLKDAYKMGYNQALDDSLKSVLIMDERDGDTGEGRIYIDKESILKNKIV